MSTTFKEEAILVLLASCSALIEMLMSSLEISSSSFFPCGMESSCFSEAVFQNKLAPRRELEVYSFKESHYYLLRPFGFVKLEESFPHIQVFFHHFKSDLGFRTA